MARVITVSRTFPAYHPKNGQPTFFPEKILNSLKIYTDDEIKDVLKTAPLAFWESLDYNVTEEKHHTVRIGRRWKTGDMASIRVWGNDINPKTGKNGPYHSRQIIIAPDVKVTVYDIIVECSKYSTQPMLTTDRKDNFHLLSLGNVSKNDGLNNEDFQDWFNPKRKNMEIEAQIICWNPNIKY